MDLKERIATELAASRARTLALLAPVAEADLWEQHSPLMSPLVWDLAHIGNYEDLWLLRALEQPGVSATYDDIYDAFKHPRRDRPALPMLGPDAARQHLEDVRVRALEVLAATDFDAGGRLLIDGFVYGMVIQHEHQHDETILATLQLMQGTGYRPARGSHPVGRPLPSKEVFVDGGPFVMGTDDDAWAYDNERPAHVVEVAPFWIDTAPVTNGDYAEFVAAAGYDEARWWTPTGWAWRQEADLRHPQFWLPEAGGGWQRNRFGWIEALPADEPVQHVCWYEADAYARWAGKRLPTEEEWEKAASWDAAAARQRRFPWGDEPRDRGLANVGQESFGPAPVGAYPRGASPSGCEQMIGNVWEWTASDFSPYPGFTSFPYREYSEVFFGPDYKVLRGGSWATHPAAIRTTFRNWDYPIRRQIFAGFRCARDA